MNDILYDQGFTDGVNEDRSMLLPHPDYQKGWKDGYSQALRWENETLPPITGFIRKAYNED